MNAENEENLKKEQNRIETLRLQLKQANQLSEDRMGLVAAERYAHSHTREWNKILFIIILILIGFISITIISEGKRKADPELTNQEEHKIFLNQLEAFCDSAQNGQVDTFTFTIPTSNNKNQKIIFTKEQ